MIYSLIFRSRWTALLWAAGICFTAYRVSAVSSAVTPASDPAAHAEGSADTSGAAVASNSGGF